MGIKLLQEILKEGMGMKLPMHEILSNELMGKLDSRDKRDQYPEGFFHWLQFNHHIWRAFDEKAYVMAAVARRPRYSARTIIEVLRWDSDLKENKPLFKISNNMVPGMARLWMAKHGEDYPEFFKLHNHPRGY